MTTPPDRRRRPGHRGAAATLVVAVLLGAWLTLRLVDASLNTFELRIDRYAVRDDARTLEVTYASGWCTGPPATQVDESAGSVDITVVERRHGPDTCPALVRDRTLTVHLDEPLGDRRVLSQGASVSRE